MHYVVAASLQISICSRQRRLLKFKIRILKYKDPSVPALCQIYTIRGTTHLPKTLRATLWFSLRLGLFLAFLVFVTAHQQTWMTQCCNISIIWIVTIKVKPVLCTHLKETYVTLPFQAWSLKQCLDQLATHLIHLVLLAHRQMTLLADKMELFARQKKLQRRVETGTAFTVSLACSIEIVCAHCRWPRSPI